MVSIWEHTGVASHVKARGRHEGDQADEEPVRRHVGLGHPQCVGASRYLALRGAGNSGSGSDMVRRKDDLGIRVKR